MDISQISSFNQRCMSFNGVLEVVDCVDYSKNKTVFRMTGLRDTFLSIFPKEVFNEEGFRFFTDTYGTNVIMQVHNVHTLKKYVNSMENMRFLGIHWDKIADEIESNHLRN